MQSVELEINLQPMHFPYPFRTKALGLHRIALFAKRRTETERVPIALVLKRSTADSEDAGPFDMTLNSNPILGLLGASNDAEVTIFDGAAQDESWVLTPKDDQALKAIKDLEDLWLLFDYTVDFNSSSSAL